MALLETIILYCQITLGIANPTSTDIQTAEYQMYGTTSTTESYYVTASPTIYENSSTGSWDINEGN